ncbi:MAG: chromate transporter [Bacillota bacterium]
MGKNKYWQLFMAFFRVGMLGYGGGPSSIPLVHGEVVDRYRWMSSEEFGDVLAIGNTLPGPISTKMAGYIGYRIAGFWGSLVSLLALVLPTILLIILLLTSLSAYKDEAWVQGLSAGVVPVVSVMLADLTWRFTKRSWMDIGISATVLLLGGSLFVLSWLGIHPAVWIALLLAFALLKPANREEGEGSEDS